MGSCSSKSGNKVAVDTVPKNALHDIRVTSQMFIQESSEKLLNVYRMGKILGKGSFGEVRVATNLKTGQQRAVKIFRKDFFTSNSPLNKIADEVEILKQLDHPNIIRLFEYYQDPKKIYIVMEKCDGGELYTQIVKLRSFSEKIAVNIVRQLLSAIAYMHDNNIMHRDLKPENILFESEDEIGLIKLIDFGSARRFNTKKPLEEIVGTLFYIAPEVLNQSYDEKCDLWSCGVITYMLLSGNPPFSGENKEIVVSIKSGEFSFDFPVWESISSESKDFIKKLLCPAAVRLSAREALKHPWIEREHAEPIPKDLQALALNSLNTFNSSNKLKEAIRAYIATKCTTIQDTKELKKLFIDIDEDKDGKISRQELLHYYRENLGDSYDEQDIEKIMNEVDSDHNGFLDYSEFIKATISDQVIKDNKNLKIAFDKFDLDKSGKISANEIKKFLRQEKFSTTISGLI